LPTDADAAPGFDVGLLSPVSAGRDAVVSDAAYAAALVRAEVALAQVLGSLGVAPRAPIEAFLAAAKPFEVDVAQLALDAVADGNPVIPLVQRLRALVADVPDAGAWVHHGVTSQDIVDTAMSLLARDAIKQASRDLDRVVRALADLAERHRDTPAAARTLTQHAVPTTVGARFADWLLQVADARDELAAAEPPLQLGGAGGTLASHVEEFGHDVAVRIVAAYAQRLGLHAAEAPWHTRRTAVTRLGDALARVTDALGRIALDVATLSRTEIGELAEGSTGGSSAMPQKQNPARSVLIRSAALRAPGLAATLHVAAANAVDERPDGAWHAEWPALRELLRIVLGSAGLGAGLVEGLVVHQDAVARNLAAGGGTIMAERLMLVLAPVIGKERVQRIVVEANQGGSITELLAAQPELAGRDLAAVLDPRGYLGIAGDIVDRAVARGRS